MSAGAQRYLLALGSNVRHRRYGPPAAVLRTALSRLESEGLAVIAVATPVISAPLGPSRRRYANTVAVVDSQLGPPALLAQLQALERAFGRRRRGRRWRARVLDLDLVLWSGGSWHSPGLIIPHAEFRRRSFVLGPAARLVPAWRDPVTLLTLAQLAARLTRPKPNLTARPRSGP